MTTITFIKSPAYTVDFKEFSPKKSAEQTTPCNKVTAVVSVLNLLFASLGQACYQTITYSGTSFKHIALGYYGSLYNFNPPRAISAEQCGDLCRPSRPPVLVCGYL